MIIFDYFSTSLLHRRLTRRIGWWEKVFFSKPIRRLEPIERPAEGATLARSLVFPGDVFTMFRTINKQAIIKIQTYI
jgi:hypothetical protein